MHTEFEIKFTNIDTEAIRNKIESLWWKCTKVRTFMKRVVFSHPSDSSGYLRVRDEGGKITTTYKHIPPGLLSVDSVQEIECEVSDFDSIRDIYLAMGLRQKAYQETYREIWKIGGEVECMIDEWPWLHPFLEIEGGDEASIRKYTQLLGLEYSDGIFGAVDQIYFLELGIPHYVLNEAIPEITFENPPKKYTLSWIL